MPDTIAEFYLKPMLPVRTKMTATGSLIKPVRCLLCDLYGTLMISGSGDVGTIRGDSHRIPLIDRLLKTYNLSIPAAQLLDNLYETIDRQLAEERASGIEHPEIRIENVWRRIVPVLADDRLKRFAIEIEIILNPVWPMPHARELLDACRSRGIRLGIISNAQFYTAYIFSLVFGRDWADLGFDSSLVILSYQYRRAKPDPLLFVKARETLRKIGIAGRKSAFIGNDMRNDIVPAARTGFQTILFAGDQRSLRLRENDPQCRSMAPDLVVTDLQELILYL